MKYLTFLKHSRTRLIKHQIFISSNLFNYCMMKIFFFSLLLVLSYSVMAMNEDPSVIQSNISEVTVFLQGAQVTRTSSFKVLTGKNNYVFKGLPENIDQQSVQVSGHGNFTILAVTTNANYFQDYESTKEIANLRDSLNALREDSGIVKNTIDILKAEEAMLMSNQSVGGSNAGLKVVDLREASDFFRSRLTDIKNKQLQSKNRYTVLLLKINRIKEQLNSLNDRQNRPSNDVVVTIAAQQASAGELTLRYQVSNAGWIPMYDVRANDVKSPVELQYKASVFQTTPESWKNVKITLSTSNPSVSGNKPLLNPWVIDFLPEVVMNKKSMRTNMAMAPVIETDKELSISDIADIAGTSEFTPVIAQTSVLFTIAIPYSISNDGKGNIVSIQNMKLPAVYEYYAAPKLNPDVFLLAKISGWEGLNLLPGEMNLFFEGTYAGKSMLDPYNTEDTLKLSLGRDKNIVITRTRLTDFSSKSFLGANKKETFGWKLSVRNLKKAPINLLLEDQLPLAANNEISVEATELSGAQLDKVTGRLQWRLIINPSDDQSFKLVYTVKYPKDKRINLD
jgi:uncharacterized protein (TIGR02231 family)